MAGTTADVPPGIPMGTPMGTPQDVPPRFARPVPSGTMRHFRKEGRTEGQGGKAGRRTGESGPPRPWE